MKPVALVLLLLLAACAGSPGRLAQSPYGHTDAESMATGGGGGGGAGGGGM